MTCQDCKKREATVQLTIIVQNEKTSVALCQDCASARGFHTPLDNAPFPLKEIVDGMVQGVKPKKKSIDPADALTCSKCGLTFEEFTQQGRFGCGECYLAFRPRLEGIMRKIHGASLHRGRNPKEEATTDDHPSIPVKEEERLEAELKKAIDGEDFERAAELRDKLKNMRDHVVAD